MKMHMTTAAIVVGNGLNGASIPVHKTSRPVSQVGSISGLQALSA